MTEIELDVRATQRRGAPREALERTAAQQRYPHTGPRASAAGWEALWRARKGWFSRVRPTSPVSNELREAGLVTDAGAPGAAARTYLDVRERGVLAISAVARSGAVTSRWSCWVAPDRALILAGPQLTSLGLPVDHRETLTLATESLATGLLVSWMGIGPTWTFGHGAGPDTYLRRAVQARMAAVTTLPATPERASWSVRRAWQEGRWTEFDLGNRRAGVRQRLIRAGDLDWFRPVDRRGGLVELQTTASTDVMREVLAVYESARGVSTSRPAGPAA